MHQPGAGTFDGALVRQELCRVRDEAAVDKEFREADLQRAAEEVPATPAAAASCTRLLRRQRRTSAAPLLAHPLPPLILKDVESAAGASPGSSPQHPRAHSQAAAVRTARSQADN